MANSSVKKLKVRFTHQQMVFLEQVKAEGIFGDTMEEVLLALLREHLKTVAPQARS